MEKRNRIIFTTFVLVLVAVWLIVSAVNLFRQSQEPVDTDAATSDPKGVIHTVCATGTVGQNGCQYIGGDGIQTAVDAAKDGDTILLKPGTYKRDNFTLYQSHTGRRKAFILVGDDNINEITDRKLLIKGEGLVVLDGENSSHALTGIALLQGDTTIQNISISGMKEDEDSCFNSSLAHINVCGNGEGVYAGGNSKVHITNSKIYANNDDGIKLWDHSQAFIYNNNIYENWPDGIDVRDHSQAFIYNNNIFDQNDGIYIISESRSYIYNNNIYENQGKGIGLQGNGQAVIYNNRINHNRHIGIFLWGNSKTIVVNNTLVANKGAGISIDYEGTGHNPTSTVINNIITLTENYPYISPGFGIEHRGIDSPGNLDRNNIFHNITYGNAAEGTGCGNWEFCDSLHADPLFENADAGNFHLQPGSPAINAGDPNLKDPDGSRSDMGAYGGPNACPGGDCSPNFTPFVLNSSFEWGNLDSWNPVSLDTAQSFVANCSTFPPCSDGQHYAKLVRVLGGSDPHLASDWIETGQNLSGQAVEVSFAARAHNTSATISGLMVQREPKDNNWGQATAVLNSTPIGQNWQTYTYRVTLPVASDGNTSSRLRVVLRPEQSLNFQLPVYYDNVQVKLIESIPPTNTPAVPPTTEPTSTIPASSTPVAVSCSEKSVHYKLGGPYEGSRVDFTVTLDKPVPTGATVVARDYHGSGLTIEYNSAPSYCLKKTSAVQSSVLGISDYYAESGSVLISIILLSAASGIIAYVIVTKNKDLVKWKPIQEKPYLAGLIVTGIVLIVGTSIYVLTRDDLSPGDTPAAIEGYMECTLPAGTQEFTYRAVIEAPVGNTVQNRVEVTTGNNPTTSECSTSFKVLAEDAPTLTPTSTGTPTPTASVTPTPSGSPTVAPSVGITPSITPSVTPSVQATPTPTLQVSDTPEVTPTIVGFVCGAADINGDGMFTLYDFGKYQEGFASYYLKTCDDRFVDYGPCRGKDVDDDGFIDLTDFGGAGIGFAQRYNRESCALP